MRHIYTNVLNKTTSLCEIYQSLLGITLGALTQLSVIVKPKQMKIRIQIKKKRKKEKEEEKEQEACRGRRHLHVCDL